MELKPGSHVYLMGICGTAMASLAGILKDMGMKVSGSDQNIYPPMSTQLEELGIPVHIGYRPENLNLRPDLVIVGNVISRSNPEVQALLESDIPYTSLPKALGEWAIGDRQSVVVAGTHGKTTTTSMTTWVSECVGLRPGFLVGGIPENFARSFRVSEGDWFIIEGDEYDTAFFDKVPKFIYYRPRHLILTSIEFDHADIYADLSAVKKSFQRLLELIPEDGTLVFHADDKNIQGLLKHTRCRNLVGYGLDSGDYRAVERMSFEGRSHFAVEHKGEKRADVALKMLGDHNVLNALAVYALARELKWPERQVLQALASFKGVKRRQQILGEPGGVLVIEDFAHHPTAVRMTLSGLRSHYPKRRLIAVFEPRSATSRRKVFQDDYAQALALADEIYVAEAFDQSKIAEGERFSSKELVTQLMDSGQKARLGKSADGIVAELKGRARKGDLVVIMSNGGFDGIYQKLLSALESRS